MNAISNNYFCQFALSFYSDKTTENALYLLQNKYQLNVNILLFCVYFAFSAQGILTIKEIEKIEQSLEKWHCYVTKAIRTLSRRSKNNPAIHAEIHQMILDMEFLTEQIECSIITDTTWRPRNKKRSNAHKIQDAIKNLHQYFECKQIVLSQDSYHAVHAILHKAFPKLTLNNHQLDLFA